MVVSGLRAVADDEGFIVAAPSGAIPLPPPGSRRIPTDTGPGMCPVCRPPPDSCHPRRPETTSEFPGRVIDVVSHAFCTDTRRTYVTGHSGGGRMASALGCRIADRIAAIAPNSGLRAGRPDPDDVTVPEVEVSARLARCRS